MENSVTRQRFLLLNAILAFLALPATVAFVVPLTFFRPDRARPFSAWGLPLLATGCLVLLACVREFYVSGRGTLAPWAPPRHLVQQGLYRYSRNPMYIGVLLIVAGWALGFHSRALWTYTLGLGVAFHLRIILGEEPWLARTHGEAWTSYRTAVPRWLRVRRQPHL